MTMPHKPAIARGRPRTNHRPESTLPSRSETRFEDADKERNDLEDNASAHDLASVETGAQGTLKSGVLVRFTRLELARSAERWRAFDQVTLEPAHRGSRTNDKPACRVRPSATSERITRRTVSTPTAATTRTRLALIERPKSGTNVARTSSAAATMPYVHHAFSATARRPRVRAEPHSRSDEPDARKQDRPTRDPHPGTIRELLRGDRPGAPACGPGCVARQLVDEVAASRPPREQQQQTDREETDRERPHLESAPSTGEPHRCHREHEGEDPEPGGKRPEHAHRRLRRVELVRVDDRYPSRRCGQALRGTSDDGDLVPELDDDRPRSRTTFPPPCG